MITGRDGARHDRRDDRRRDGRHPVAVHHAGADLGVPDPWARPADPRQGGPRARAPHGQAGHADDGRHRHRRRGVHRLARRPRPPRAAVLRPGADRVGRRPGDGLHGLPRRLHQGPQAPQPRHLLEAEELRHDADELRHRLVARRVDRDLDDDLADPRRLPRLGAADGRVGDLGRADHLGDDQRRQRHRRARRPGRRLGADGLRGVHDHRLLGVPEPGDLRRRRQPARPRRPRRGVRRGLHGVPVVQRRAGADHHGRRRRARARLGARPAGADDEHPAAAAADLRAQRHRGRLGGPADGSCSRPADASGGCSGCRRSTTTSSSSAGRRRR